MRHQPKSVRFFVAGVLVSAIGMVAAAQKNPPTIITLCEQDASKLDLSPGAVQWVSPGGESVEMRLDDKGARISIRRGDTFTEASRAIQLATTDFKSRHSCQSRGNNVRALKWIRDSRHLLILTEVYPTGDCGPDLGHAEGYLVAAPNGKIERRLTLNQLKAFPGICTQRVGEGQLA